MSSVKRTTMKVTCLASDALVLCFEFVGHGSYRFVAGTCRRFRKLYSKVEREKRTFWRNAALSIFHAEMCLRDHELLTRMRMERQPVVRSLVFRTPVRRRPSFQEHLSIHTKRQRILRRLVFLAIKDGGRGRSLEVLPWAHARGIDWKKFISARGVTILDEAVATNYIPVLEYLRKVGCEWTPQAFSIGVHLGYLEMLRYLQERGCDWDADVFTYATILGNLEIVKYLHESGCDKHEGRLLTTAAIEKHQQILQYLIEDAGCNLVEHSRFCLHAAAKAGHLDVLRYLHHIGALRHGGNFSICCVAASYYGQLEVLQYVVGHGSVEWNDSLVELCLREAEGNGHGHVVEWIEDQNS